MMGTRKIAIVATEAEVDLLPRHQRDVIRLHMAGRPYLEIAAELGIPLGTVRSRVNRGRAKLKDGADANQNP